MLIDWLERVVDNFTDFNSRLWDRGLGWGIGCGLYWLCCVGMVGVGYYTNQPIIQLFGAAGALLYVVVANVVEGDHKRTAPPVSASTIPPPAPPSLSPGPSATTTPALDRVDKGLIIALIAIVLVGVGVIMLPWWAWLIPVGLIALAAYAAYNLLGKEVNPNTIAGQWWTNRRTDKVTAAARAHERELLEMQSFSAYELRALETVSAESIEQTRQDGAISVAALQYLSQKQQIVLTSQEAAKVRAWQAAENARIRAHEASQARKTRGHQATQSAAERKLRKDLAQMDGRIRKDIEAAEQSSKLDQLVTRLKMEMEMMEVRLKYEQPDVQQEVKDRMAKLKGRLDELELINAMPEGYQKEQAFRMWKQGL